MASQGGGSPPPGNGRPTIGVLQQRLISKAENTRWWGAIDAAREEDANVICVLGGRIGAPQGREIQASVLYSLLDPKRFDGLNVWLASIGLYLSRQEQEEAARRFRSLPTVIGDQALEGVPAVLMSQDAGMSQAIRHLVQTHGLRRIAFIRGPAGHRVAEERYRAYCDAVAAWGLALDPRLVTPPGDWEHWGAQAARILIDERSLRPSEDFQAVVGCSMSVAYEAMTDLQERGIRIPDQVAIVGFGDSEEALATTPPMTAVSVPVYAAAQRMVKGLLARLRGEQVAEQETLACHFVIRQSCGCRAASVTRATGPIPDGDKSFLAALGERDAIVAEVRRSVGTSAATPERVGFLVDACVAEVSGARPGALLSALEEVTRHTIAAGDDVAAWQAAVSTLRDRLAPFLDGESRFRAEDLWGQARVSIGESAARVQARQALQVQWQVQILQEISQNLLTSFDIDQLVTELMSGLPRLGIPGCYLSLYEDPQHYEYPHPPPQWSRLVLAYNENGRMECEPGGRRFTSRLLVPDGVLPAARRYDLVLQTLCFEGLQIGFVLFEAGPRDGLIYEMLRAQISTALHGALIVRQIRERSGELARQKYILDTFMENVPDRIYFKDLDGRITRSNRAHAVLSGVGDPAVEIGKSDLDLYPREDAQERHEQDQSIIRTGQPILNLEESDGRGHWALSTKMPLRDEQGTIIGTFGISKDITDRVLAEEKLRVLFGSMSELVFLYDGHGRFVEVNAAACLSLGYSHDELMRMSIDELAAPGCGTPLGDRIREIAAPSGSFETALATKAGAAVPVEVNAQAVAISSEILFLTIARDITERKKSDEGRRRLESMLLQAQKLEAVGQLGAGVAHEFNNILAGIMGFASVLLTRIPGDGPLRGLVDQILVASRRAADLARGLLIFSGQQRSVLGMVDLNEVVRASAIVLSPMIGEKYDFRSELSSVSMPLLADGAQIGQILLNLVTNARDAMPDGGTILVRVTCEKIDSPPVSAGSGPGSYAHLSLSDTGIGMDEETRARVFEPFFTTKDVGKGTGLGLSIVWGIVEQHQGFVTVDSEPGKGTTFHVYLPIRRGTGPGAAAPA